MLEPGSVLHDRYRLDELVGEGGMATVYRAHDTRLSRVVAIKLLHPQFAGDAAFLQRFQQEGEFAASLGSHPNIVAIYDIGQDRRFHYIVMEFVAGESLKELIVERGPLGVPEAFAIGQQVGAALDFAHKRGLVHRDVKPQNIMVTPEGIAKVTDFGIARGMAASQLTRTGMVIGTVHYFSPEQAQGKPAGPQSDIYSLGIILYEMLTGHLPFDAENAVAIAMQHVHSEPPSPWSFNPDLPARAVGIVMRALEKDPSRRFRDAGEMASALAAEAGNDTGNTTVFSPLPPGGQAGGTAVYRLAPEPVPEVVPTRRVAAPPAPARPLPAAQSPLRTLGLVLLALLLIAGIAGGAFFLTSNALGGSATPTPTATPRPSPTPRPHRRKPTPVPTRAAVIPPPQPTFTPAPLPTWTPTPLPTQPPAPTPTPKPVLPTNTPKPIEPTFTPEPLGPPLTPTTAG